MADAAVASAFYKGVVSYMQDPSQLDAILAEIQAAANGLLTLGQPHPGTETMDAIVGSVPALILIGAIVIPAAIYLLLGVGEKLLAESEHAPPENSAPGCGSSFP